MNLLDACPTPPDGSVDWEGLRRHHDCIDRLHGCPQNPVHHAEGDVGVHTRMACDVLAASDRFGQLSEAHRRIVFGGILLHDVAKPACTRHDSDGNLTARGHSARGELMTRRLLWEQAVPFAEREAICALVRHHQVPFFLIEREDSQRLALSISQSVRCDLLALVAWADGAGRTCADQQRILDNVALFEEFCREQGCLDRAWPFASEHARFEYFRRPGRSPEFAAHDDTAFEVTVMSGLPAAGKDHWIRTHAADLPQISLDAIRRQLGVDPGDKQGRVIDRARSLALDLLRQKQPFVYNATNLSRALREPFIHRCADYGARVRLVYVERPAATTRGANRSRKEPVPEGAIARMLDRWEVPQPIEAHRVDHVVTGESAIT